MRRFVREEFVPNTFKSRDGKEAFMQWGLENTLAFCRFKIVGNGETEELLEEFFTDSLVLEALGISEGVNIDSNFRVLSTSVRSMDFFDRLMNSGVIAPSGSILNCSDETVDGIVISDRLKEALVNPDSENASIFTSSDRHEFIYFIFKILCVGGAMCQPDINISRYLDITKSLYKELLVLYKVADTGDIKSACTVYSLGPNLATSIFPPDALVPHSYLIIIINSLERYVTTLKVTYRTFW